MSDAIRVFIGTPENGLDAEQQCVCEYSLRKHTSEDVQITWLSNTDDETSLLYGWDRGNWSTPFSGYRWATPYLAKTGKAIYLDCDVVIQRNLLDLWNIELPRGKIAAARGGWRYCVALFDVSAALEVMLPLDELKKADGHQRQNYFFRTHPKLTHSFGSAWNYLDNEDYGPVNEAAIVHYTDLRWQPSFQHAVKRLKLQGKTHWNRRPIARHPRPEISKLFENLLVEAQESGYTFGLG